MTQNDAVFIQRVLQGDQEAFGPLVNKYQSGVHALVWRKIGDFHIAQEITQDAFLKAYQKLQTLKNHNAFAGWLYVIAANLCSDWLRKRPLPEQSLEVTEASEVAQVSYAQYVAEKQDAEVDETRREIVKKLLQKLPESERTVMTLYYLGEMTIKTISEFLGVSQNTVKSRLSRARNRLKQEENVIQQHLGSFQLPSHLTANIMHEVSRTNLSAPTGSKPLVPWVVSATSTLLFFLLIGTGTQYLSRFQKPYNLNATSERTVEIIDALFVLDSPAKPAVRNQQGSSDIPGKNNGTGEKPDALLFTALPVDEVEVSTPESQWVPTGGPEGGSVNSLFVASNGDLYTGIGFTASNDDLSSRTGTDLYRLADDGRVWNLIKSGVPFKGSWQMAEHGRTLYVVSGTDVFASIDRGETWNTLGTRPEGRLIDIVITDESFYLGLIDGVFRSTDNGKSWISLKGNLADRKIHALTTVENTLFVGTDAGLYRFDSEGWKQLSIGKDENIRALTSTGYRLYVVIGEESKDQLTPEIISIFTSRKPSLQLYRSTDAGDSWQLIDPTKVLPVQATRTTSFTLGSAGNSKAEPASSVKIVATQESLLVFDGRRVYYSSDAGETWTALHSSQDKPPYVVMLGENTFYKGGHDGIHRTIDAGKTWQQFNTGLVNTTIEHLVAVDDTLYANIGYMLLSSSDDGESWTPVSGNPGNLTGMIEYDGVLYGRGAKNMTPRLFWLSTEDEGLTLIPGVPDLEDTDFNERITEKINLSFLETLHDKGIKNIEDRKEVNPEHFDEKKFSEAYSNIVEENMAHYLQSYLGSFAVSHETYYMESRQNLFRWKPGTTEWYDTGLIDENASTYDLKEFNDPNDIGFNIAVSGRTVYVGKRDGHLFQSFDEGDTWNDVSMDLPFTVASYNVIAFAGSKVYIATDKGVAYSNDGTDWHTATDTEGEPLIIEKFGMDGTNVYGATERQVYRLEGSSNTWKQVNPEVPSKITSLTVAGNTLYVGTLGRGVLRFILD